MVDKEQIRVEETVNELQYFVGDATPENVAVASEYYLNSPDATNKYNFNIYTKEELAEHCKLYAKAIDLWAFRFKKNTDKNGESK